MFFFLLTISVNEQCDAAEYLEKILRQTGPEASQVISLSCRCCFKMIPVHLYNFISGLSDVSVFFEHLDI